MINKEKVSKIVYDKVRSSIIASKSFIIAANWKMNKNAVEVCEFMHKLNALEWCPKNTVIIFPPYIYAFIAKEILKNSRALYGLQNVYSESHGAFTGEISPKMALDMGCKYIIVGHSERRNIFHETDEMLNKKVKSVLNHDMIPILCVGENLDERKGLRFKERIREQVLKGMDNIAYEHLTRMVIAYEPVWAIGTGLSATPSQIGEIHSYIKSLLHENYGKLLADVLPILYGGSVKVDNVTEIALVEGVSGFLIGGASLKFDEFYRIIKSLE